MLDGICLDEKYYTECQSNQAGEVVMPGNASLIMILNLLFIKKSVNLKYEYTNLQFPIAKQRTI